MNPDEANAEKSCDIVKLRWKCDGCGLTIIGTRKRRNSSKLDTDCQKCGSEKWSLLEKILIHKTYDVKDIRRQS